MKVSIVSPAYKSELIIPELVRQLECVLNHCSVDYEIILVDDRSPDNSWSVIQALGRKNINIKGLRLSRNFGQHFALTAGIKAATGDYVVIMDCDLQDDPAYIPELLKAAEEGHEVVLTKKQKRKHGFFKNICAYFFFKLLNFVSVQKEATQDVGNFSLLSRKAKEAFLQFSDVHRHYLMIVRMLGYRVAYIPVVHKKRYEGKTSYTLLKLMRHGVDGLVSQSSTILYVSVFIGFFFCVLSFFGAFYYVFHYFSTHVIPGYTSLVVLILLSTGLIMMSIGVMGIYIGKIFDQVRGRPLYLIDEKINL